MEAATLPGRRTAAPALRHRADRVRAAVLGRPELPVLLALAALLNLWALSRNGFANQYYAAAVRSMGSSWHAFIFGSFDPSGVMTVDKPPLASWVQVASTKVFGYGSWGILLPQAVMGVITVGLVYDLTRRLFGRPAGVVAGLVLALTPMTVAISRHNNPDALLVLCSVAAVWLLVRALQDPSRATRFLALSGVAVGLGFETKMAVALMVVPGIVAAWLWVRPAGLRLAAAQIAAFTGAALVVGGAWPLLMLLTPAADRPWVSGTSDNSILSLIFGYNGLGRLDGQAGGPGGMAGGPGGGRGPGGAGGPFGGPTGPFRLLEQSLGGQAGWLIGAALVGGLGVVAASRLRRTDVRSGWIICVGGAFVCAAVAFSTAKGIFHPYYVSLLAPFTAALVGAVAGYALRGDVLGKAVGAAAVLAGMVTTMAVLHHQPGQFDAIKPLLVTGSVVAAIALVTSLTFRWRAALLGAALALLLMAPATWAVQTLGHATQGTFPAGGPANAGGGFGGPGGGGRPGGGMRGMRFGGGAGFRLPSMGAGRAGGFGAGGGPAMGGGGGMFGGDNSALTSAARYAKAHGGGTVVTASQSGASAPIISSDANVAAIGGFSGRESQVTTSWLAGEVRDGRIRWVLSDGQGGGFGGPDGRVGASKVMSRVQSVCTPVSSQSGLYDCAGKAAAIAAAGS